MLAEVAHLEALVEQRPRRLREEHLSAVAGGHHARRLMHVEADVAAVDRSRLARVQADSHQNFVLVGPGVLRKRLLGLGGGEGRFSGGGERDEERVTLAVDYEAVVLFACLPEQTVVLSEQVGVGVSGSLQQPSRALDVAEQQRDGAAGRFGHGSSIALAGASSKVLEPALRLLDGAEPHEAWVVAVAPRPLPLVAEVRRAPIHQKSESQPQSAFRQLSRLPLQSSTSLRIRCARALPHPAELEPQRQVEPHDRVRLREDGFAELRLVVAVDHPPFRCHRLAHARAKLLGGWLAPVRPVVERVELDVGQLEPARQLLREGRLSRSRKCP